MRIFKIFDYLGENDYNKNLSFLDEIQEVEDWEKWIDRIKKKVFNNNNWFKFPNVKFRDF